jgi:hypothetical protein
MRAGHAVYGAYKSTTRDAPVLPFASALGAARAAVEALEHESRVGPA